MIPVSISPSSLSTFEACPARYKVESVEARAAKLNFANNVPAMKGTVCHTALQTFIESGYHEDPTAKFTRLEAELIKAYYGLFSEPTYMDECRKMLENWFNRTSFIGRSVISTEVKKSIQVPYLDSTGNQQFMTFNYICDRVDRLDDGTIEVVDYKTVARAISPDELKGKIQVRCYALGAQIDHPAADGIWVTYDLLRYSTVSAPFTRDDNIATWTYLKNVAQRIYESDGSEEMVNDTCRFCMRKLECNSLQTYHRIAGPNFDNPNLDEVAEYRYKAKAAMDALKVTLGLADEVLGTYMDTTDVTDAELDKYNIKIRNRSERKVDGIRVADIIGPEKAARYGTIGVRELDRILEDSTLADSTRSQLKQLVRKDVTSSWIEVKPRKEIDDDI